MEIPTTAYVAYHSPPVSVFLEGKKGAAMSAMLSAILTHTALNQDL